MPRRLSVQQCVRSSALRLDDRLLQSLVGRVDRGHKGRGLGVEAGENVVDVAQARVVEQALLVGDPGRASGQDGVGRLGGGGGDRAGGAREVAALGIGVAAVDQLELGLVPPAVGGLAAQFLGEFGAGEFAVQNLGDREFGDDEVGGDTGAVEGQQFDVEAALAGLVNALLDVVEVAGVDVDAAPVDLDPVASGEAAAAPAADLGGFAGPSDGAQVAGVETGAVVDGEVPVAVGGVGAGGAGSAEGDRADAA